MHTRKVIVLVLALAVAAALCITNPRRGEYVEWAIDKSRPDSGHLLSGVIRHETAPMYVDFATVSRNFGLFSLFSTETGEGESLITLGICKQYVLIKGYGGPKE